MHIILALKIIFDMFWQFKWIQMGLCVAIAAVSIRHIQAIFRRMLKQPNIILLFFLLALTGSFFTGYQYSAKWAAIDFIKIASSCWLFFLAQHVGNIKKIQEWILGACLVAVSVNTVMIFSPYGYVEWTQWAETFKGMYFFKTDAAVAFMLSAIFIRQWYVQKSLKIKRNVALAYLFFLMPLFVVLTDSRVFFFLYLGFVFILQCEYCWLRDIKRYKALLYVIFVPVLMIIFMQILWRSPMAKDKNYFSYKMFGNIAEIAQTTAQLQEFKEIDAIKTQKRLLNEITSGRLGLWRTIIKNFRNGPFVSQLTGYGLWCDTLLSQPVGMEAHSSFIKLLISTGYFGLISFCWFLAYLLWTVAKQGLKAFRLKSADESFLYATIGFLLFLFILLSLTTSAIAYTQLSWFVFFFCGVMFNKKALSEYKGGQRDTK